MKLALADVLIGACGLAGALGVLLAVLHVTATWPKPQLIKAVPIDNASVFDTPAKTPDSTPTPQERRRATDARE